MGWEFSTYGGEETEFRSENLKGRDYSEDLGVDERMLLEWDFRGKLWGGGGVAECLYLFQDRDQW
jgi:hypothetical protein